MGGGGERGTILAGDGKMKDGNKIELEVEPWPNQ